MLKNIFAALSCASVALAFGACSSDSGGGTAAPKACEQIVHDPKYPTEQCNNAADRCYLESHQADVRAVGGSCAVPGCLQFISDPYGADAINCVVSCLVPGLKTKTGATVSNSCAECAGATVACGATFCAAQCAGSVGTSNGPDSAGCTACLCAQHTAGDAGGHPFSGNCLQDAFAECAGFRPTNAQVGCP